MIPVRALAGFARVLLAICVRGERRAEMISDLEELYAARCTRDGRRLATWRLLADVLSLCWRATPFRRTQPARRTRRDAAAAWRRGGWADLRVACREWRRAPVRTTASIGSLVVGLSTSIVAFSVVNAWIAADIPGMRDRGTLRRVVVQRGFESRATRAEARAALAMSWETVILASESRTDGVIDVAGALASVELHDVSGRLFEVLGTTPAVGRLLQPSDDSVTAMPTAVISYSLWQRRFGGESVIGRPVTVFAPRSGQPGRTFTIVGVAPSNFAGVEQRNYGAGNTGREVVWIPAVHAMPERRDGGGESLDVRIMARLQARPTVAAAELAGRRLGGASGEGAAALALRPYFFAPVSDVDDIVTSALVLMSVPLAVVLIVCVNVASLRLASAAGRSHELAVRASLGATRWRLVRLLALETIATTAVACLASWIIARWVLGLGVASGLPVALDARVAAFAIGLAGSAALLAGVWPAFRATGPQLRAVIDRGASGAGSGAPRLQAWLVTCQMAVSLVLLVFGSLVVKGLVNLQPGDVTERVAPLGAVSFRFVDSTMDAPGRLEALHALERQVAGLSGVEYAAVASGRGIGFQSAYVESMDAGTRPARLAGAAVSSGFFDTWAIPVLQGRGFGAADPPDVAVVTQALQETLAPGRSLVGARIVVRLSGQAPREVTVVGVIDDFIGTIGFRPSSAPEPRVFLPFGRAVAEDVTVFTRSARPEMVLPAVLDVVRAAPTPLLVMSATEVSEAAMPQGPLVTLAGVMGGAGLFALAIAALGLWAVMSLHVARRQREFGIRLAVGGRPSTLLRLLLGESARIIVFGGIAGAVLGTPILFAMRGEMIGVDVWDPIAIVSALVVLAAAALAASIGPALRAARVDPIEALRGG